MSTGRDEIIEHLRALFGEQNALDLFASGLDDPDFDVDKPYRGRTLPKELSDYLSSDAGKMLIELMTFNLRQYAFYAGRDYVEDFYTISAIKAAPVEQTSSVTVA